MVLDIQETSSNQHLKQLVVHIIQQTFPWGGRPNVNYGNGNHYGGSGKVVLSSVLRIVVNSDKI